MSDLLENKRSEATIASEKKGFFSASNRVLHLFVLNAFFLAQPLFELLSKNIPFFIARNTQPYEILLLTFLLCAFIPTLIALLLRVFNKNTVLFRLTVKAFCILGFAPLVKTFLPDLTAIIFFPLLLVLSIVVVALYAGNRTLREFLSFLAPVVVIFPIIFLFFSPVKKLLFDTTTLPQAPVIESSIPVTLVIFDELPLTGLLNSQGKIDGSLYPHFARLAKQSTWYKNATTVHDRTAFAVPAILSGLMPDTFRPGTFKGYPENIFTLFQDGYSQNVVESTSRLCPTALCEPIREPFATRLQSHFADIGLIYGHLVLPKELKATLPSVDKDWGDFWDTSKGLKKRASAFQHWVQKVGPSQRSLNVLHVELPHGPRGFLPSGKLYDDGSKKRPLYGFKVNESTGFNEWVTPWLASQHYQRQLMQLQYTDTLLGLLLEQLKTQKTFDSGLFIVTADHGISFRRNTPVRDLNENNFMDIMPVPLLVKYPYQTEEKVSLAQATTIDILPTVMDVLNISTDWKLPGVSLQSESLERSTKMAYNRSLEKFEFPISAFEAKKETLNRKSRLFLPGTLSLNTDINHFPTNLFGKSLREFSVQKGSVGTVEIDTPEAFNQVDLASDFLPALLLGQVTLISQQQGTLPLALFLNDQLVSYTQSEPINHNKATFGFLIPEDSFQAGHNSIKLFMVNRNNNQLELQPLSL